MSTPDGLLQRTDSPSHGALDSFYRASRFLASILDLDELLGALLHEGLDAVGGTRGFVALVNRSNGDLELRITAGRGWDEMPTRRLPITDEPGSGITVRVVRTGEPYVTGDVRRDEHYRMFFPDVRSEIAVPLLNRDGRAMGVLNVECETVDAFDGRDLQLLLALANQAAIAISVTNSRARETMLIEVGNELATCSNMDELFSRVVHSATELLRADDGALFQLNSDGEFLLLRAGGPLLADHAGKLTYRIGEGLTGSTARDGLPVRVANVRDDSRWRGLYPPLPADMIESFLAAPIFVPDGMWGVLRVLRRRPASYGIRYDFTDRDEELLETLGRQVGAAIAQHSLLARQLRLERMAAWGEMSARSAHMIGNKVFALRGQLSELEHLASGDAFSREAVLALSQRSRQSLHSLEEILADFRDFLTATYVEPKPCVLNTAVESIVCETIPEGGPIRVELELAPELPMVSLDLRRFSRALSELLENAVTHLGKAPNSRITVRTGLWDEEERRTFPQIPFRLSLASGSGAVRIEVIDNGPGVPLENKKKLFNAFFTTRARGMGLGLSIVKGIVDAHSGVIYEVGEEGEGARFIIILPALGDKASEGNLK